jgi:hypothetical protein
MPEALSPASLLAQQLLDAQVTFIKSRLTGDEAPQHFVRILDFALAQANTLSLEQAVDLQSVKEVVKVYAFELNLGAGILELIGAIAQRIYGEISHSSATLLQLVGQQNIEQWIDKILELEQVRTHIIEAIQNSPTALHIITQIVSSLIKSQRAEWLESMHDVNVLPEWIGKSVFSGKLKHFLRQQEDKFLHLTEQQLAHFIQQQSKHLLQLDNQDLKDIALEVWQSVQNIPLNELSEGVTALDIEEFFVLIYEFWRHLRQTEYMQKLILTGVDVFFEVYGQYPISELLEEIGISRQHLINDLNRFLPKLIETLNQHDVLDQLIRLQLAEFYQEPSTLALIEASLH